MHHPTSISGDDWSNVTDPKERKRVQDRLAQRARRKRLADGKGTKGVPPKSPAAIKSSPNSSALQKSSKAMSVPAAFASPGAPFGVSWSVLSALFINGQMLGLKCGISFPAKSCAAASEVPCSLRPTLLQMSTVHFTWIDRYPLEESRDELIISTGAYDEEEYLYDLFNMPSFTIDPGYASWDPKGWKMETEWRRKWGWLFPSFATASDEKCNSRG